jgi:mannan endo-1,4-beta-mannosidase
MRYRITTVPLIVMVIATVFQISLVSATSIVGWEGDSSAWSKRVEGAEGQKQNTIGQVLQASRATVQAVNPNASDEAKKEHSIFLPLLSRGTTSHPANPNASDDAKKVLSYTASLPNRPGRRVISGQHLGYRIRDAARGYDDYVVALYEATGKWVGMIGLDYGLGCTADEISAGNQILIDYWNNGGLVTIEYHVNNPWTGGSCNDLTSRNLIELITPGTAVNETWMAELDKVATGLAELRDAGVVVLWRPFHEMTYTECFWWDAGAHPGDPEPFKEMWKHMFNYFSDDKALDNLLWVYAPANVGWRAVDYAYPGDSYVDIVGIDEYGDQISFITPLGDNYSKALALGKPFALTETGPHPTRDGSWDNMNLISRIRNNYPKIAYFQYWHSWTDNKVAMVDHRNASALLNDPWVITRDELDWGSEPSP